MFKDRKFHKIFKRQPAQETCESDHLYQSVLELNEEDLFDINDMHFLIEINDLNMSKSNIYNAMVIHQVSWNSNFSETYKTYLRWWKEGRFNQKDLQIFFCSFNLFLGILVAVTSFYSTPKNENIKIGFRGIQIVILWILFFESILRYRIVFKEIIDNNSITTPSVQIEVMHAKQFYTQSIDFLDTSMIASVTTTIFLAVMQKWYYRKPSVAQSRVTLQQLQTFQPFFDDDQI